ncbi:anthranilate phosphoribosyltransferase family protein [Phormidesmis sp. 146-33]
MSNEFRALLRKVGSGPHTSEDLSRVEAAAATRMILLQEATPAQIGAFMIAHRIKRPTGEELAGMLDAYDLLGPKLQPIAASYPATVFSIPYDGRSRTAPILPITTLILVAAGVPVILHGGDRMPTKEGIPLIELWNSLGIHWEKLSLAQVQQVLEATKLGFVYVPNHFPLAQGIVPYRDQIGKRPPFSTLELMWSPYAGETHLVSGFVHPPTENMFREAFALRGLQHFTTVKGLEGSCDLPRDRTAIIGLNTPTHPSNLTSESTFDRLHLVPREFGFAGKEVAIASPDDLITSFQTVLQGKPSEMMQAVLWNGGFYLWRCGVCSDIQAGFSLAEALLSQGKVAQTLKQIIAAVDAASAVSSRD